MPAPPLIAHIIHRLDIGGLENGLVNLINYMPGERYRHAIICLTEATEFRQRIQRPDMVVFELHKRVGQDWGLYGRLWRLLRQLRPAIVHTRNLGALESQLAALCAGVKVRIHSEHGWDVQDPDGRNRKYRMLRRLLRPTVKHYIALSGQLEDYLRQRIGVPRQRLSRLCNGVDTVRFKPANGVRETVLNPTCTRPENLLIGSVGRMEEIKDPLNLVRAFVLLLQRRPDARQRLRLVMIGAGSLQTQVQALLEQHQALPFAWLPGAQDNIPELLRSLDIFVLPSRAEGISNTILEAMASGLPVVATEVGGNSELVVPGETGFLVPASDPAALAAALARYIDNPELIRQHGRAARRRAEQEFSIESMVQRYLAVYDRFCQDSV